MVVEEEKAKAYRYKPVDLFLHYVAATKKKIWMSQVRLSDTALVLPLFFSLASKILGARVKPSIPTASILHFQQCFKLQLHSNTPRPNANH